MALYRVEGIVLKTRELGEADKIVTLYCRDQGKVRAVARGSRRPRNRLSSGTQLFTYGEFLLSEGKNLDAISQAEIRESFRGLREDLARMAYASYVMELTGEMVEAKEPNEPLFLLLLGVLHLLGEDDPGNHETIVRFFELKLLTLLGYRPHLRNCVSCSNPEVSFFSPALGGMVCRRCREQVPGATEVVKVAPGTVQAMRKLDESRFHGARAVKPGATINREMEFVTRTYITYLLEKPLKSWAFLDMVRAN
mgnify:CR=1 FL=1